MCWQFQIQDSGYQSAGGLLPYFCGSILEFFHKLQLRHVLPLAIQLVEIPVIYKISFAEVC